VVGGSGDKETQAAWSALPWNRKKNLKGETLPGKKNFNWKKGEGGSVETDLKEQPGGSPGRDEESPAQRERESADLTKNRGFQKKGTDRRTAKGRRLRTW